MLAGLALVAYVWTLRSAGQAAERLGGSVEAAGERIADIGERFRTGTITQTFLSSIPRIHGTGLGNLELATTEITELLSVTDERRILWDWVSLGETASEIRVPVTYRYHLRLADTWQVDISEQTIVVHAPAIRASLPPAIDTETMTKRTEQSWLRFNGQDQLEQLERSLTPTLERFAQDGPHLDLVREQCRRTVAGFVRAWLLSENQWGADRFRSIVVVFPDESPSADDLRMPTLELQE